MDVFFEFAGFFGVALYIGAYAALQTGLIGGRSYPYSLANLSASALVLVSLVSNFNLWSALIQISWIAISLVGLTRLYLVSRRLRFTDEEQALRTTQFSEMPPKLLRRLLDAGSWADGTPGQVLAREGENVGHLYVLTQGAAEITLGGKPLARVEAPVFLGEVTALHGGTAIATVTLGAPSRFFLVASERLRGLAAGDTDMRVHLDYALGKSTRSKLSVANARLRDAS